MLIVKNSAFFHNFISLMWLLLKFDTIEIDSILFATLKTWLRWPRGKNQTRQEAMQESYLLDWIQHYLSRSQEDCCTVYMRNAFRKCHVHLFGIFRKHIRFLPKALFATITPKPYRKVCPIFTKHLYCMAFWLSMAKVYRHHILLQAFSISVCYIYLRKVIHHKLSTPGYYMTACWCSKKVRALFMPRW